MKARLLLIVVGFDAGGGYDAYARLIGRSFLQAYPRQSHHCGSEQAGCRQPCRRELALQCGCERRNRYRKRCSKHASGPDLSGAGRFVRCDKVQLDRQSDSRQSRIDHIAPVRSGFAGHRAEPGRVDLWKLGAGPTVTFANAIGRLLSSDVRVVSGYPGVAAVTLAMQRNEVNCNAGQAWSSMKATMAQLMREGQLNVIVQWGTASDPEISSVAGRDVPLILDYARTDLDRNALRLLASTSPLSRPLLTPPGLPPERVGVLRQAFDRTMSDPAFLDDAKRSGLDIKPISGAAMQTLVDGVVHSSPSDIAAALRLTQ